MAAQQPFHKPVQVGTGSVLGLLKSSLAYCVGSGFAHSTQAPAILLRLRPTYSGYGQRDSFTLCRLWVDYEVSLSRLWVILHVGERQLALRHCRGR